MPAVVRISDGASRARVKHWANIAEDGVTVTFRKPSHSDDQRRKFWAMMGDLSKQIDLHGKKVSKETWRFMMMRELWHETKAEAFNVSFETDLRGEVFPVGLSTKELPAKVYGDLITVSLKTGDELGVNWSKDALTQPEDRK